ncbi:MAG: HAD hydrolase-like protein [Chloroflexi bacterium]|nr:HAD hydrolase-like protein [Chloroflexota bacterium]
MTGLSTAHHPQIRGVIFDFDGTVADTLRLVISGFQEAVVSVGGPSFTDADVYDYFGPTEAGMLRRAVGDRWPEAYRVYLAAYERDHGAYDHLFYGVVELMTSLRARGIRVGLVTGKGRDSAEISVRRTGLGPLLEGFETGSDDGLAKAHGITRVREAWGLAADEVAYIGDTPDDMKSCLEAGVTGLGAAWAKTASVVADPRWHCFGSVAELTAWLDAHVDGSFSRP